MAAASTSSTAAWAWGTSMQGGRLGRWDRVPAASSLSEVLDTVLAALADRFSCLAFLALRACGVRGREEREMREVRVVSWVGSGRGRQHHTQQTGHAAATRSKLHSAQQPSNTARRVAASGCLRSPAARSRRCGRWAGQTAGWR